MVRLLNDQYSNFLQQADALRVSGALCDAFISVEGQGFRAHRLVLACASRRLAQLLTQGAAHQPVNCTLELLSAHTFQQLLDFSYSQALEVPQADLHQLLRAAQLLEMQSLEEQCQKQLDALDRQATEATETAETSKAADTGTSGERQASSGSNLPKKEPQGRTSPVGEHEGSPVLDSPPSAQMKISSAPPPKKRPLVAVPAPVGLPFRDSVIAGTASSHAPPSPSRYRWHSVSALRKITLNYSDLMASHSLHSSQQIVPYPFPLSGPHMYPLLASPIPAQVHSSFMGYPGIFHPYSHTLLAGSSELGDELKKELLGKGDTSDKVLIEGGPGERTRFHGEELADKTRRIQDCVHFSRADQQRSWRESPATSVSGGASLGCGFYGQRRKVGRSQRRGYSVEKPYQCKSCAKRFSLKHQLDTHHRVHTGEKPFECRLCGQRSRDYSAMIKHLRTHGGAMPYQCTFCLEYSSSLAAMQKHLKGHPVQDFPSDWNISSTYLYSCHT